MFSFFENLPQGIPLEIVNKLPRKYQARVVRVNKFFNGLAQDQSLELAQYKAAVTTHSIGNARLILTENIGWKKKISPYVLFLTRNGKEVSDSGMVIFEKSYLGLKSALEGDSQSLINKLNTMSKTASSISDILKEEFENQIAPSIKM